MPPPHSYSKFYVVLNQNIKGINEDWLGMAINDIYGNKEKYEKFKGFYKELILTPENRKNIYRRKGSYICKNPKNIEYYSKLFLSFESKDISFVRRNRLIGTFKMICHVPSKDLKDLDRPDIDEIVKFMHTRYNSIESKENFITDIKFLWKILFPEKDEKGRIDDDKIPYVVRHLNGKVDKSREQKKEILEPEEYLKLVSYFENNKRVQAFITIAYETCVRPQELLYTRLKDVKTYDNYARISISSHGKEGTKTLQVIDSYQYLIDWLDKHPLKDNKDSYLFPNISKHNFGGLLLPHNINKFIKTGLMRLGIKKKITCYSLKRTGITHRRLKGDSDLEIQHTAGWTSTRQLKTYDQSNQQHVFKIQLAKKGLIDDEKYKEFLPENKNCLFCGRINKFSDKFCSNCKRPFDRKTIKEREEKLEALLKFIDVEQVKRLFKLFYKLKRENKVKQRLIKD